MAHVLVLGANGHIGAHIVRALLADGHTVRAGYRNEKYLQVLEGLEVDRRRIDLDNSNTLELEQALEGCDWVFHAAGYYPAKQARRAEAIEHGIQSTRRILGVIRRAHPKRVVFTSSAACIRQLPDRVVSEQDAENWPLSGWRSLYAAVKIAMEQEVLRAHQEGLPVVITNPSICIGEYDAHAFSGRAVLAFVKYRIPWIIKTSFNVVYTGDVGVGHLRTAEQGRLGERYLLAGANVTLEEFAEVVTRVAQVPKPWGHLPYPLVMFSAFILEGLAGLTRRRPIYSREDVRRAYRTYSLDGSKAVRDLGMPQTPVEEAVRRAVDWFRANGYIKP